jgi:hypothetical protein
MNAPLGSTLEDGDCNTTEDVCNSAIVGTSSSDGTFANNRDSEPTDVAAPVNCGNGNVDPGEQCDPPSAEICNDTVDNDADQLVDCSDPDCLTPGFQSCDGNCQLTAPCVPILNDPARLTWDYFKVHGRYIPTTEANPLLEGFIVQITNTDGTIYRGELKPGDLQLVGGTRLKRWAFRDRGARDGNGIRDGLSRVFVKQRMERDGTISYPFKIKAYGDMARAVKKRMTTQVYIGGDVGFLTASWLGEPGRWRLTLKQASAGFVPLSDD